jgi:aspartyl aminopeptidase
MDMSTGQPGISESLLRFIDSSPSPHHVVANTADRLRESGFTELAESEPWDTEDAYGGHYICRGGSVVAWRSAVGLSGEDGFRIIGAHTDSPNLRVKPRPDTGRAGWRQLGVEVYGGVLLNSWLDRDLGLSGTVVLKDGDQIKTRLLTINEPILRIPQLAIHLDREIGERGLQLNRQTHMAPIWGLGEPVEGEFVEFLAEKLGVATESVISWTVMTHDLTPATIAGRSGEFIAAPRIDNQASCFAALEALINAEAAKQVQVICLFDHEEVGSISAAGAGGALLPTVIERIGHCLGGDASAHAVALARSSCVSADGAHATHPNYADRHEPDHHIALNRGPVIKQNANERYATDAATAAMFAVVCQEAGVPHQWFVSRTDLACGSTIGPVTAAQLGIPTVDVGIPQLAMHSARELCGSQDPHNFALALTNYLGD